jgi:lysophospholipase L1-like esterase
MIPRLLAMLVVCLAALPAAAQTQPCGDGQPCVNILFDGDSISAGYGTSPGKRPQQLMQQALGQPARIRNVAVGGRPVYQCLDRYPMNVAPNFEPAAQTNLIVFHAGDNDIAQGRDADATYQAFTTYVQTAHRQGWKVLVSTELPRPDFNPAREAALLAYNRLLIANGAGAEAVVDLSALPRLYDPQHRDASGWYSETPIPIHPNDAGYTAMMTLLTAQARQLLHQP